MQKKRILILSGLLLLGAVIVCLLLLRPPAEKKGISIYDSKGNLLIHATGQGDIYEETCWAYLDVVLTQTAEILVKETGCQPEEAVAQLFTEGYHVYTFFDPQLYQKVSTAMEQWEGDSGAACALTDLGGKLLSVYSTREQQKNHANRRIPPYSSFKALSVYTPAIEAGLIQWSDLYHDSPYKTLGDTGWPVNADGSYSQKDVTVYDGLRKSLNTVAVKCLADFGVDNSIAFLQNQLGIPLQEEAYVAKTYGAEEVLGNIALGYLETGLTPVEMAGYYQIFATGGLYTPPSSVESISTETGEAVYTRQPEPQQVISPATADTMNRLLQGVLTSGGTGVDARCKGIPIAGKTGTGDGYSDSWFVGVTPGYSCALWHGQSDSNTADRLFASVISELYREDTTSPGSFVPHQNLHKIAFCTKSGKAFSTACTSIDTGYFIDPHSIGECTICNNQITGGATQ